MGLSKGLRLMNETLPSPPATQVDFSGALLESLAALLLSQGQGRVLHSVWQLQVRLPDNTVGGTTHFFLPLQDGFSP
jgi:hypothetical protein